MKYEGEKIQCNNLIECDITNAIQPYLDKCEKYIKENDFEHIIIKIKKGMPIKYIVDLSKYWDIDKYSSFAWLCTYMQIGTDGRIVNYDRGKNLEAIYLLSDVNYYILSYMIKYNKINEEKIKEILKNSEILNNEDFINKEYTIDLISHGFKKVLENDYISAIHILIPQIEYMLRSICKINDVEHLNKRIKEKYNCENFYELSKIIQCLRESDVYYPDYFLNYLELYLLNSSNDSGLNYRNDVCHGVPTGLNKYLSATLVLILLYLIN